MPNTLFLSDIFGNSYSGSFNSILNTIYNTPEAALGCTDSNACNYSNTAVQDDGTCSYDWQANYDGSGNSIGCNWAYYSNNYHYEVISYEENPSLAMSFDECAEGCTAGDCLGFTFGSGYCILWKNNLP